MWGRDRLNKTWGWGAGLAALLVSSIAIASPPGRAEAAEEAPQGESFVLPPQAESILRKALLDGGGPGRLKLSSVTLDRDRVRLGLPGQGGELSLRHPSLREGALLLLPALSVHGGEASDALLRGLKARLRDLKPEALWRRVSEPESPQPERTPSGAKGGVDPPGLVRAMHQAREALRTEARAQVLPLMKPYLASPEGLSIPARVDIATVLTRAGEVDRARSLLAGVNPEGRGQALALQLRVLRGEPLDASSISASLKSAEEPCELVAVANLLTSLGEVQGASALISQLAERDPPCPQALVITIRRLLNEAKVSEADRRSERALMAHPEVKELVSVRARVLIAAQRPKEAAALLEAHARRDPRSVALSSLLGAYNRVESIAWKREKMEEMAQSARANPDDHVAAFIAGVLLHYDGRLKESDAMLTPLLETPINDQARLYIYLGMNAFDLGQPERGLALVDRAANSAHPDPDVHYCRAEILRMNDPVAAREALLRYLSYTDTSATKNSAKQGRVNELLVNLERCVAEGTKTPCPGPWEHPRGEGVSLFDYRTSHPPPYGYYALIALALSLVAGLWFRRRSVS